MCLLIGIIGIKLGLLTALRTYTDFKEDEFDDDQAEAAVRLVRDQLEVLNGIMSGFDNSKYFSYVPSERLQCLNEGAEFLQKSKELEQRFMSNVLRMSKAFNLCNSRKDFTNEELDLIHYYKALRSILFKLIKGDAPDTDIDPILQMILMMIVTTVTSTTIASTMIVQVRETTPMNDLHQPSMTCLVIQDSRTEKPLTSGHINVEENRYGGADSLLPFLIFPVPFCLVPVCPQNSSR